jgi:hypothetical protein
MPRISKNWRQLCHGAATINLNATAKRPIGKVDRDQQFLALTSPQKGDDARPI